MKALVGADDIHPVQVQIIGSARAPFAVRSGGHASNPGFSSTTGVHISLNRMDQAVLSADNSTVKIGMGTVSAFPIKSHGRAHVTSFRPGPTSTKSSRRLGTMLLVGVRLALELVDSRSVVDFLGKKEKNAPVPTKDSTERTETVR